MLRQLFETRERLLSLGSEADAWIHSTEGADLWLDGWSILQSVHEETFGRVASGLLVDLASSVSAGRSWSDVIAGLARIDQARAAVGERPELIRALLAVGLTLVARVGGPPRIIEKADIAIINDTLLFVVSPWYRVVRCRAYNDGCSVVERDHGTGLPPFWPEFGVFAIGPPYVTWERPRRIHCFCINHDLLHLAWFADAYWRQHGTIDDTAALLQNVEEAACGFDLVLVRDLLTTHLNLHVLDEVTRIESSARLGERRTPEGVFAPDIGVTRRWASSEAQIRSMQRALKVAGQRALRGQGQVTASIGTALVPAEIYDWFSVDALRSHATGSQSFAARNHHPVFARFAHLLPQDRRANLRARRTVSETWGRPPRCPVPDPLRRERGHQRQRRRLLVLQAARFATREPEQADRLFAICERWRLNPVQLREALQPYGISDELSGADRLSAGDT